MSFFETILKTYRHTLKRVPGVHRLAYVSGMRLFLPALEMLMNFRTIPTDPINWRLKLIFGAWEPGMVRLVKRIIEPGMVCLDIGAHVGYYTRLFANLVGPGGLVVAFEPHPNIHGILKQNVSNRRNVKLVQAAVAAEDSLIRLFEHVGGSGLSSIQKNVFLDEYAHATSSGEIAPWLKNTLRVYEVNAVAVDSWLKEQHTANLNFIKMDIEGAELLALQGMKNTIRRLRELRMIIEFNPAGLKNFQTDPHLFFDFLRELGFVSIGIIQETGDVEEIRKDMLQELIPSLEKTYDSVNLFVKK